MRYALRRRDGVMVATLALCGLWWLASLATWSSLVEGPRFGSPWTTYGYGQALLAYGGIQIAPVLATAALQVAAVLAGYALVVRPIWGHLAVPLPWLLAAGLIPGSFLLIALTRLFTLLLPNTLAPGVIGLVLIAGCVLVVARGWRSRRELLLRAGGWRDVVMVGALLAAAFIFSVQLDRSHVAGEGSTWFMYSMYLTEAYGVRSAGSWPLISQHYDEAAFLYPAIYGLLQPGWDAMGTLTAAYWVMLACGRVGAVAITFVAVRGLGVDRLSALLLVAFVCGASLSLNPLSSRVLFDSLSPLAFTLHISRFTVAVLPVLLLSAMVSLGTRASRWHVVIALILGVGVSSMPFHVVTVLIWSLLVAAAAAWFRQSGRTAESWRAPVVGAFIVLAAFSIAYGVPGLPDPFRILLLLASGVLALAIPLWCVWRERSERVRGAVPAMVPVAAALLAGCVIGLVFFGNVLLTTVWAWLQGLWPYQNVQVLSRLSDAVYAPVFEWRQSSYCADGYEWGFRILTGHCGSLGMFARTYGLSLVAGAGVLAWLRSISWRPGTAVGSIMPLLFWGMTLSIAAHAFGFVIFDFVSPVGDAADPLHQLSVWLRSRLLEPWFYGVILLASALFFREADQVWRTRLQSALLIATALFLLSPLVLPAQLIANVAYLVLFILG